MPEFDFFSLKTRLISSGARKNKGFDGRPSVGLVTPCLCFLPLKSGLEGQSDNRYRAEYMTVVLTVVITAILEVQC